VGCEKVTMALGGVVLHTHNNTIQWRLLKHDKNPKEKGKGTEKEKGDGCYSAKHIRQMEAIRAKK
jgi:hypothetical protein